MRSLWDLPAVEAEAVPIPLAPPLPRSVPPAPITPASLPLRARAPGEWPDRDTVCTLASDEARVPYAVVGQMPCGRDSTYALVVPWAARDARETPRQVVPSEHLRVALPTKKRQTRTIRAEKRI